MRVVGAAAPTLPVVPEASALVIWHLSSDKVGLLIDVVQGWPKARVWLSDGEGDPFDSLADAVRAILDVPTPFIPIGCPTPDAEGRCPGHADG